MYKIGSTDIKKGKNTMNKRILSMILALVMVVLAVPVFSLALAAEEAAPSYRPTTSSLVLDGENWPVWTYHADEVGGHGNTGCYRFTPADETGIFGDTWSFGSYLNGTFVEFGRYSSNYGQLTYGSTNVWGQGYIAVHDGGIGAGDQDMTELGFSYIAPYTGTVDLSFAIGMQQYAKFTFGIKVDGKLVYPAQDGGETWATLTAGDNAFEAKGIEVKAGQRISFLFKHNKAWDYLGKFKSASVTYTEVKATTEASYTVDAGANKMADGTGTIGWLIGGEVGYAAYPGLLGWTSGQMNSSGFVEYTTIGSHGWIGTENVESGLWGGNGGYNIYHQAMTPTVSNMAVAMQYTAEFDGTVEFGVSLFKFIETKQNGATNYFTVYVNDKAVWPVGAQDYANGGYAVTVEDVTAVSTMDVASAMSAAMDGFSVNVKKGDKISFTMYRPAEEIYEQNYMSVAYGPTVTYTAFNFGPAFASAQVALNEAFAVKLNFDKTTLFAGATELGAYVGEDFIPAVDGTVTVSGIAAKKLVDGITVRPACTLGTEQVIGEAITVSPAALLQNYVTGEYSTKVKNLAAATLNYAAAAQKYFDYKTDTLANAGLDAALQAYAYTGTYTSALKIEGNKAENVATPRTATLLLGDTVSLKFVFTAAGEGFAENYRFALLDANGNAVKTVTPVLCDGQVNTYKAIFEGVMPTMWNTVYTVAVIAADDTATQPTAIGQTVDYSVMSYLVRASAKSENPTLASDVAPAMYALYEAAVAYAGGNTMIEPSDDNSLLVDIVA